MAWIGDMLKEVPLSAVLKERVALAEQKYEGLVRENGTLKQRIAELEAENANLRAQVIPKKNDELRAESIAVLVQIFDAGDDDRDVTSLARALEMDPRVLQYHLDRLDEPDLADYGENSLGEISWYVTTKGRRYVVERNLVQ